MVRFRRRWVTFLPFLFASRSLAVSEVTLPMRIKTLDYLDADALRYYLDEHTTTDYDVAIMFYAQRDKLSHKIAPVWDQISRILSAGTTQSNLIVSLFDCETDDEHLELCRTARVTHYPAFVYTSLAANHTLAWTKTPKHVVHYPGSNWQQGDAILDWIRTMKALSNWHRAGWSQRVRRVLFPFLFWGKSDSGGSESASKALPLGVPQVQAEKKKLDEMAKKTKETETLAARTSNLLESILFPLSEDNAPMIASDKDNRNYTDVFAWMDAETAWESKANKDVILRSCVVELSGDYCERWSTVFMEEWIADLPPGKFSLSEKDLEGFAADLQSYLNDTEPYCAILDDCAASDFNSSASCRPATCPFRDATVCRYVTSCLRKSLQAEYAEALGLSGDATKPAGGIGAATATTGGSNNGGASKTSSTSASSTKDETNTKKKKSKPFSWGL